MYALSVIIIAIVMVLSMCQEAYSIQPQDTFSFCILLLAVLAVAKLVGTSKGLRDEYTLLGVMSIVVVSLVAWMIYKDVIRLRNDRKEDETKERYF